jgi:hypothetical protein
VNWLVEANVSEKSSASIFRAEDEDSNQKNIIRIVTAVKKLNLTNLVNIFVQTFD